MPKETKKSKTFSTRQEGYAWVTPTLIFKNLDKAVQFYTKAFGFNEDFNVKDKTGNSTMVKMSYNDSTFMFSSKEDMGVDKQIKTPKESGQRSPISLYMYCEDVDATFERAIKNGAKKVSNPEDMFWGDRMATVEDPEGYLWMIAKQVSDFDPSKMPTEVKSSKR